MRKAVVTFLAIIIYSVPFGFLPDMWAADLDPARPARNMQPAAPVKPGTPAMIRPVKAVDLMVVPRSLRWRVFPVVGQGSANGSFQYTVKNIGGAPANPVVRFTCTGISGGRSCPRQMNGSTTLGQMDGAGGMNTQKTDFWPLPPGGSDTWQAGSYEFRVQIVAGRGQTEPNTANNIQTLRFTVAGGKTVPGAATEVKNSTPIQVKGINPRPEPHGSIPVSRERFRTEKRTAEGTLPEIRKMPGRKDLADRIAAELEAIGKTMNDAALYEKRIKPERGQGLTLGNRLEEHRSRLQTLEDELKAWEKELRGVGEDSQLANIELQKMLQKQQQLIQILSKISKTLHDTAMAVIRKIG